MSMSHMGFVIRSITSLYGLAVLTRSQTFLIIILPVNQRKA